MTARSFLGGDVPSPPEPNGEPYGVSQVTTPSGLEVYYQAGPERLYRVRQWTNDLHRSGDNIGDFIEPRWVEVPSVTTILDILDKPGLRWWAMKQGVQGVLSLLERGAVEHLAGDEPVDEIVSLLTKNKLTINHVTAKAGHRGTVVHAALEQWAETFIIPSRDVYDPEEQGYIDGLIAFLTDLLGPQLDRVSDVQSEVMVGSLAHNYAGRYDLRCEFSGGHLVHKTYPKREDKRVLFNDGIYLFDLKTSKGVYDTHFLQLEAYEAASIECGYEPTDTRAVVHVTEDGRYEVVPSLMSPKAFPLVRQLYGYLVEGW